MLQTQPAGKMQEYTSNIEFSLNFEDKKKSARVKVGDKVLFDGVIAKHVDNRTGEESMGRAVPLKSAVANNWLSLTGSPIGAINVRTEKVREDVPSKVPGYDKKIGGSFEEFLKDEGIAEPKKPKYEVVAEEDQVIKKTSFERGPEKIAKERAGKFEVSGDQVDVKTIKVSNSTAASAEQKTKRMPVIQQDDGHADYVIISKGKEPVKAQEKPKNSFTVDGSTPTLPIDATMNEVRRAVTPIEFNESQDGVVVGVIGQKKLAAAMVDEPNEVEGIVLKKTASTKTASSGSTPVADLSGVKTQAEVNQIEKGLDKSEVAKTSAAPKSFVDQLPDDWGAMHWTKKEKFITQITDSNLVKYIMTVETAKVIQNACRKRLDELEKSNG